MFGYVSVIGFVVMASISSFAAGYGARLLHKTPRRRLEITFGIVSCLDGGALHGEPLFESLSGKCTPLQIP